MTASGVLSSWEASAANCDRVATAVFQTRQHRVPDLDEPLEFIAGFGDRQALRKVIDLDGASRERDLVDGPQRAPAEPRAAEACDGDHAGNETEQEQAKQFQRANHCARRCARFEIERLTLPGEALPDNAEVTFRGAALRPPPRSPVRKVEFKAARAAQGHVAGGGQGLAEFVEFVAQVVTGFFGGFSAEVSFETACGVRDILIEVVDEALPQRQLDQTGEEPSAEASTRAYHAVRRNRIDRTRNIDL